MDTRELTAYALIALLIIAVSLAIWRFRKKRKDLRREMRGYRR